MLGLSSDENITRHVYQHFFSNSDRGAMKGPDGGL